MELSQNIDHFTAVGLFIGLHIDIVCIGQHFYNALKIFRLMQLILRSTDYQCWIWYRRQSVPYTVAGQGQNG